MNMSKFSLRNRIEPSKSESVRSEFVSFAGQDGESNLLDKFNSNPIGRLLNLIGSLPEVRHEKVFEIRRQIDEDRYDLNESLDLALDKVIEELITES